MWTLTRSICRRTSNQLAPKLRALKMASDTPGKSELPYALTLLGAYTTCLEGRGGGREGGEGGRRGREGAGAEDNKKNRLFIITTDKSHYFVYTKSQFHVCSTK